MSDKTRLARYFYLNFLWTAAKRLKTFGRACRDDPSLAKTVLTLIDESSEMCEHLALFYIRSADPIVNRLLGETCWSLNPARLPGGATESEGLAKTFWKRVVWTRCVCTGRKKEGVTLRLSHLWKSCRLLLCASVLFGPVIVLPLSQFLKTLHIGMKKCGWRDF